MWWLCRRQNMKLVLKSTISARRISCWTDPRGSPVLPTAVGASHRHFAEVRGPPSPRGVVAVGRALRAGTL